MASARGDVTQIASDYAAGLRDRANVDAAGIAAPVASSVFIVS